MSNIEASTIIHQRVSFKMGEAKITDKRWSIDLEKRIQEEHYDDEEEYDKRYAFNPESPKELFVIDTPTISQWNLAYWGCSSIFND